MKILLTGGSGFIGASLHDALGAEHDIHAPGHRELDVSDSTAVDALFHARRFDAVIHAAVEGGDQVVENIVRGYWNLARHSGEVERFFFFGSGAEYGKHRDLDKVREEEIGEEVPRDAYGFGKLLCNESARRSSNIVNLRLFGVYGPRENYLFKFISNSVVKILLGLDLAVRQDADFDYLWIDDLAVVVRSLLETGCAWRDLNVTPTESISLSRIVDVLRDVSGIDARATFETPGMNFRYTGDNSRLREAVPDLRFTAAAEGIRRLFARYKERAGSLDREALVRDDYFRQCRVRA
jgi:nucleoside-diphosphate-sugar epimerase